MTKITVGLDEAGTGAWAGEASCCAFAAYDADDEWLLRSGARDSKATKDHARRLQIREALVPCAIIAKVEMISAAALSADHRAAWRAGMAKAASYVLQVVGRDVTVIVDGNPDQKLTDYLLRAFDVMPLYRPKADITVPAVSAASIFAKAARTEAMLELAKQYPGYGWENNDGYGTKEHQHAIERLGVTPAHRRIRPLLRYFETSSEQLGIKGVL